MPETPKALHAPPSPALSSSKHPASAKSGEAEPKHLRSNTMAMIAQSSKMSLADSELTADNDGQASMVFTVRETQEVTSAAGSKGKGHGSSSALPNPTEKKPQVALQEPLPTPEPAKTPVPASAASPGSLALALPPGQPSPPSPAPPARTPTKPRVPPGTFVDASSLTVSSKGQSKAALAPKQEGYWKWFGLIGTNNQRRNLPLNGLAPHVNMEVYGPYVHRS